MIDSIITPSMKVRTSAEVTALRESIGGPNYLDVSRANAWSIGCDFDDPSRRKWIFDTFILGPCLRTPQQAAFSAIQGMQNHDAEPAARACKIPMAYISADVPLVAVTRDLERLRDYCPQLVEAKTLLAGHFNTIEVADQVNAMIERFLAVALRLGRA
ncbi:MAG: alpha/beta fold hydrolase [Janthinobacterium lividum]